MSDVERAKAKVESLAGGPRRDLPEAYPTPTDSDAANLLETHGASAHSDHDRTRAAAAKAGSRPMRQRAAERYAVGTITWAIPTKSVQIA
ncbi:MAG TPA: hypothetical protein VMS08_01455 [Candidatus Saccharimonadia bacterium]|nr:hypothetical protein [Candidatus Saccharimonadia bacterium]